MAPHAAPALCPHIGQLGMLRSCRAQTPTSAVLIKCQATRPRQSPHRTEKHSHKNATAPTSVPKAADVTTLRKGTGLTPLTASTMSAKRQRPTTHNARNTTTFHTCPVALSHGGAARFCVRSAMVFDKSKSLHLYVVV
jgi:hypothetical protein